MADPLPEEGRLTLRRILSIFAIFLVLIGLVQIYSVPANWQIVVPKYFWIVALGILLLVISFLIKPGRAIKTPLPRFSLPGKTGWIFMAFMLSALAAIAMVAFEKGGRVNFIPVITFWLAAGLVYLSTFRSGFLSFTAWKDWFKANKRELVLLGLVVLVAVALRFYKLGSAPYVLNGDEGRMGIMAKQTNAGELANPFALWENFGALYLQAIDFCFKVFGYNSFALRLLPAIGGVLAVPAVYLLARKIAGPRVALISSALLAFSHTHMHFSRTAAVGYIHATWLVPLELYFLLSGIEKRNSWRTALAGIMLGIHFSIYLTSQIVTGMIFVYLLIAFLVFRAWLKPALKQVLAFWGGLGLMLIPEAVYVLRNPGLFLNRLNQDGTFQSGWLEQTIASTGNNAVQILAGRVWHAFLALIYYPAVDFYGSSIPMLSLIAATLFLVGLVIVLLRKYTPGSLLLNGYFWGFTLAVGIFSVPPSADSYRMLIALPAALIMAGIGLDFILETIGLGWEKMQTAYIAVSSFVLVSLLIFNMWSYFDDFIGHCLYGEDKVTRFASYLGTYVGTVDDREVPIYLLSDGIFFYGSHASAQFLGHDRVVTNVPDSLDTLSLVSGDIVIATPDRIGELETWANIHPGGQIEYEYDCESRIMLIYQIP